MTSTIGRAAEIIGQHVKCGWSICERRRRSEDGKLPPLDACGNTNPSCRDVAEGIAQDLADAGLLAPDKPKANDPTANFVPDGKGWLIDGLKGPVVWTAPGGTVMVQRIEPGDLTPAEARDLALALLAAADYAEGVGRAGGNHE